MARTFEVPLYQLFYEGEEPPTVPPLLKQQKSADEGTWGKLWQRFAVSEKLHQALAKSNEQDRKIILLMAQKMSRR